MPTIKLQSSDGVIVEVDLKVAQLSLTIKNMLEDPDVNEDDVTIPLSNVNSVILEMIIKWANHHKDDPPQADDADQEISSFDEAFLNVDPGTLFELILAANYLDIKGLLEITCKTVANMINGKSPDDIRTKFNIKNDFTPFEEQQIRKENEWCEKENK